MAFSAPKLSHLLVSLRLYVKREDQYPELEPNSVWVKLPGKMTHSEIYFTAKKVVFLSDYP